MAVKPQSKKNGSNGHSEISNEQLQALVDETPGGTPTNEAKPINIEIPELKLGLLSIEVESDSPLIMNKFSEKAIGMMLSKQMGAAKQKKAAKVPAQDFLAALYTVDNKPATLVEKDGETFAEGRFCFPASGFRQATIAACRFVEGLKMTTTRGAFQMLGEYVEIISDEPPRMRRDLVRLAGPSRVADIRFRPEFKKWGATLLIRYNVNVINPSQLANLINNSGFGCGIGEWRPEKGGSFGTFHVKAQTEVKSV